MIDIKDKGGQTTTSRRLQGRQGRERAERDRHDLAAKQSEERRRRDTHEYVRKMLHAIVEEFIKAYLGIPLVQRLHAHIAARS